MKRQPVKSLILATVALLSVGTVVDGLFHSSLVTQRAEAIVGGSCHADRRGRNRPTQHPARNSTFHHLRHQSTGGLFHRDR
jgi:hypothetical protein